MTAAGGLRLSALVRARLCVTQRAIDILHCFTQTLLHLRQYRAHLLATDTDPIGDFAHGSTFTDERDDLLPDRRQTCCLRPSGYGPLGPRRHLQCEQQIVTGARFSDNFLIVDQKLTVFSFGCLGRPSGRAVLGSQYHTRLKSTLKGTRSRTH